MIGRTERVIWALARYLKLLQRGAHEAKLDDDYTKWLDAMNCVPSNKRGQE